MPRNDAESPDPIWQRLCLHWYHQDKDAPYDLGVTVEVERAEKCFLCGHCRWWISTNEGYEPHPDREYDASGELSRSGLTVMEVRESE